jgi:hypothetical protein
MSSFLKKHVGKSEELYDFKKTQWKNLKIYILYETPKNPMGKIRESY